MLQVMKHGIWLGGMALECYTIYMVDVIDAIGDDKMLKRDAIFYRTCMYF